MRLILTFALCSSGPITPIRSGAANSSESLFSNWSVSCSFKVVLSITDMLIFPFLHTRVWMVRYMNSRVCLPHYRASKVRRPVSKDIYLPQVGMNLLDSMSGDNFLFGVPSDTCSLFKGLWRILGMSPNTQSDTGSGLVLLVNSLPLLVAILSL